MPILHISLANYAFSGAFGGTRNAFHPISAPPDAHRDIYKYVSFASRSVTYSHTLKSVPHARNLT